MPALKCRLDEKLRFLSTGMTSLANQHVIGLFPNQSRRKARRTTTGISEAMRRSLRMLVKSREYARNVRHANWDFAIEIQRLRETGLSDCDLRWLVCKGYLEQACEITLPTQVGRSFRALACLKFLDESCFVLTEEGVSFAQEVCGLLRQTQPQDEPQDGIAPACCGPKLPAGPSWDAIHLELRVGSYVVKRYRVPAPNQEVVLATFEEENWTERIDDPLAPTAEIDPKRRLHSTIQCLNRNQRRRLIHFRGDGHGTGVCWELVG